MKNIISKLMVLTAMSFFITTHTAQADSKASDVKKAASKIIESVSSQPTRHAIGFGLGQTFLLGNFEKKGDNKITTDIFYSYTASHSFDLLVNAHISHHHYKQKGVWLRGYTMSIKGKTYDYDAFSPFVLGGLGFYMPQIKDYRGVTSDPKYTFGVNAGAGIDLKLNKRVVIGILAQYHFPFEVKQDTTENVRGSYLKLLLTAMYLF